MTPPRVSVIMPVFNVQDYIAEAIESVLAQSFTDFELIIIDDGGTDRSMEICLSYADPRIRIIRQANRGLAGARNTGIRHAVGEIVALLDSDDRWLPEKLMLHMIHLDATPAVDVSFCGSRFIDLEGHPLRQAQSPKLGSITAADIVCRNPVGNGSAAVIRRSALDAIAFAHPDEPERTCWFDESFRQSEDIELWVRMALKGCRFDGIKPLLTEYRIVSGGLSANIARQFATWLRMIEKAQAIDPAFIKRHGARAKAYQLRYLARRAVQMGDAGFAQSLLKDAWAASKAPFIEEPVKSAITIGAAFIARHVDPQHFSRLAHRWTGGRIVA